MIKLFQRALTVTALFIVSTVFPTTTLYAGTCASKCGPHPIQFQPGDRIRLEVVNHTSNLVKLQRIQGIEPVPILPGQELGLDQANGTTPNLSLIFWDTTGLSLRTIVSQPKAKTLRIEIRPGGLPAGDRSIYIQNDGRVNIL